MSWSIIPTILNMDLSHTHWGGYISSFVTSHSLVFMGVCMNVFYVIACIGFVILISLGLWSLHSNQVKIANMLSFSEKELNSIEDLYYTFSYIVSIFFINFFSLFCFFGKLAMSPIFIAVFVAGISLVLIPATLLTHLGYYFVVCLRGSSVNLSIVYELFLDYINTLSYFLRLVIQLVRIVIISVIFILYNEVIYSYSYIYSPVSCTSRPTNFVTDVILGVYVRVVFELVHVALIFIAQFSAFVVMLFWLFQYLCTLFFGLTLESYFEVLRRGTRFEKL